MGAAAGWDGEEATSMSLVLSPLIDSKGCRAALLFTRLGTATGMERIRLPAVRVLAWAGTLLLLAVVVE